jgi:hypothetical protein
VDIINNTVCLKDGKQAEQSKSGGQGTNICVVNLTNISQRHPPMYRIEYENDHERYIGKDLKGRTVVYFRILLDEKRITTRKCSQDSQPSAGEQKE